MSHSPGRLLDFLPSAQRERRVASTHVATSVAAKHSRPTIILHWGTVFAVVVMVAAIYLRELTEDKGIRQVLLEIHRQLGLLILVGVALRLWVRYWIGLADHSSKLPALMRWAATATHVVLYGMLIALPLLGWAATSAHGIDLKFLGVIQLPGLTGSDTDVAEQLDDYHKWVAYVLGGLIVLHASAALWHHFVRRDGVLTSMLPGRKPARRRSADLSGEAQSSESD
jgi:cytochrome b561